MSRAAGISALAVAGVVVVALAVRYAPWPRIFTPAGVRLAADGDPYYHALRAERIAREWPAVPWRDPGMSHPDGADIPWPPLLDQIVATLAIATGPASSEHVARVAAVLPPLFGAAVVVITAALGAALLGGPGWWEAALLVALLPAAVRLGFVGRADHHVLEVLLGAAAVLAYARGLARRRSLGPPLALAVALTLAFWNWPGSALYLALLAGHVGLAHLLGAPGAEVAAWAASRLALAGALTALLLAASIAALGPAGALASLGLTPISGLSPLLAAWTAAGAGLVALARRRDPSAGWLRRAAHLALASALPLGLLSAFVPALRAGLGHGLTALGAASSWYATIAEFWPALGSGRQPWTLEAKLLLIGFGLTPLLLPAALHRIRQHWRREPEQRGTLGLFAWWLVAMVLLALARRRFEGDAVLPLALASALVIRDAISGISARAGWLALGIRLAALLAVVGPGLALVLGGGVAEPPAGAAEKGPLLELLRQAPVRAGREGVLSHWSEGHEIQWLARKPVVSTPFGTDIDPRALADQAAFFTTPDADAAAALLRRRQVGFLLLANPVREIATLGPLAPGSPVWAVEERSLSRGATYAMHESLFDLVVSRLYFLDGGSRGGRAPTLPGYRLLGESATVGEVLGHTAAAYKLFGVVEGAALEVRGASPGATVLARVDVVTNRGRRIAWGTATVASGDGLARLRVPWATGLNGGCRAGAVELSDGLRVAQVELSEADVVTGAIITRDLGR